MNPPTRFERLHIVEDPALLDEEDLRRRETEFLKDTSRSVLSRNDSPDVAFTYSVNPYRGCEHGCVYCYARPSHEYLGFSAGLDFETRILVKHDAPKLLEAALKKRSWKPQVVSLCGNTDPYQPIERKLKLTRACLETLLRFRNPVYVITKNGLITRDLDLLQELATNNLVRATISLTSLRPEVTAVMEPRTARPALRLKTIETLAKAGVPVVVNVAPVVPGLTDEELGDILRAAREAGAGSAYYQIVRLPGAVKEIFAEWARRTFPDRAEKMLRRIESLQGKNMNAAQFFERHTGRGEWAPVIENLFRVTCARLGLDTRLPVLRTDLFRIPDSAGSEPQLSLF